MEGIETCNCLQEKPQLLVQQFRRRCERGWKSWMILKRWACTRAGGARCRGTMKRRWATMRNINLASLQLLGGVARSQQLVSIQGARRRSQLIGPRAMLEAPVDQSWPAGCSLHAAALEPCGMIHPLLCVYKALSVGILWSPFPPSQVSRQLQSCPAVANYGGPFTQKPWMGPSAPAPLRAQGKRLWLCRRACAFYRLHRNCWKKASLWSQIQSLASLA